MLTSATTFRTGRSVLEASGREPVIHFEDLGLTGRVLAPQREDAELVVVQIDLTPHQAIRPDLAQRPSPPQQAHLAQAAAAPQVDQLAPRPFLKLQSPAGGERPAL